jgi:hypothetical protein
MSDAEKLALLEAAALNLHRRLFKLEALFASQQSALRTMVDAMKGLQTQLDAIQPTQSRPAATVTVLQ